MKDKNSNKDFRILGFNIGNTNSMLGIYTENSIKPEKIYTYKTERKISKSRLWKIINNSKNDFSKRINGNAIISGSVVSSVVTELDSVYTELLTEKFNHKPVEVSSKIKTGIKIQYKDPTELGADRISNAVAAYREYKKDTIIIDLGTALTISIINANGVFEGGLIAPGIGSSMEALVEKTSKLFKVEFEKPMEIIAKNTKEAIKSGYFYSSLSVIEGLIKKINTNYKKKFLIILTGGLSEIINPYIEIKHITEPLLIMKGIKYIYNLNINF